MAATTSTISANENETSTVSFLSIVTDDDKKMIKKDGKVLCHVLCNDEPQIQAISLEDLRNSGIYIQDGPDTYDKMEKENMTSPDAEGLKSSEFEWSTPETKLLLDKYEAYMGLIGPMKKFKNRKAMWVQISSDIREILGVVRTPGQCDNRYKTVMRRKKLATDNNRSTGRSRKEVEFETEIQKIAQLDDSIQPEVLRGVGQVIHTPKRKNDDEQQQKKKKTLSISETLLEINKIREEARERRHKEKMELLRELFNN